MIFFFLFFFLAKKKLYFLNLAALNTIPVCKQWILLQQVNQGETAEANNHYGGPVPPQAIFSL